MRKTKTLSEARAAWAALTNQREVPRDLSELEVWLNDQTGHAGFGLKDESREHYLAWRAYEQRQGKVWTIEDGWPAGWAPSPEVSPWHAHVNGRRGRRTRG
jgi:hypothetical protein